MHNSRRKPQLQLLISGLTVSLIIFFLSGIGIFREIYSLSLWVVEGINQPLVNIADNLSSAWVGLSELQTIRMDNQDLLDENNKLQVQVDELEDVVSQNVWLREQLNLVGADRQLPQSLAEVVRYQQLPVPGYIYITASDKVAIGDYLQASGYLVGEIVEVLPGYAKARLFVAPDTVIPVHINRRILGVLEGQAGLSLQVTEIDPGAVVPLDAKVYLLTSDNLAAAEFPVGKVDQIASDPNSTVQTVKLRFPVDVQTLEFVTVIHHES